MSDSDVSAKLVRALDRNDRRTAERLVRAVLDDELNRTYHFGDETRKTASDAVRELTLSGLAGRLREVAVMTEYCFVALLVCWIVPLIPAFLIFDALLRREYSEVPAEWERDGRPRGYFWYPPERSEFSGALKRGAILRGWLFATPAWINDDSRHRTLLRWLRVSVAAWAIIVTIGTGATFLFCE